MHLARLARGWAVVGAHTVAAVPPASFPAKSPTSSRNNQDIVITYGQPHPSPPLSSLDVAKMGTDLATEQRAFSPLSVWGKEQGWVMVPRAGEGLLGVLSHHTGPQDRALRAPTSTVFPLPLLLVFLSPSLPSPPSSFCPTFPCCFAVSPQWPQLLPSPSVRSQASESQHGLRQTLTVGF